MTAPAILVQSRAFIAELIAMGYSEAFYRAYLHHEPHELTVIEFMPEEAFVQTPGPSAGSALTP